MVEVTLCIVVICFGGTGGLNDCAHDVESEKIVALLLPLAELKPGAAYEDIFRDFGSAKLPTTGFL